MKRKLMMCYLILVWIGAMIWGIQMLKAGENAGQIWLSIFAAVDSFLLGAVQLILLFGVATRMFKNFDSVLCASILFVPLIFLGLDSEPGTGIYIWFALLALLQCGACTLLLQTCEDKYKGETL